MQHKIIPDKQTMNPTIEYDNLPDNHPLKAGEVISVHSPDVLTKPVMFIDVPYQHDKRDRCGRTCRNCTHCFYQDGKWSCYMHDEKPARNPRARALKCKYFEHWRKALEQFLF